VIVNYLKNKYIYLKTMCSTNQLDDNDCDIIKILFNVISLSVSNNTDF